jgi:hypothetical protein
MLPLIPRASPAGRNKAQVFRAAAFIHCPQMDYAGIVRSLSLIRRLP